MDSLPTLSHRLRRKNGTLCSHDEFGSVISCSDGVFFLFLTPKKFTLLRTAASSQLHHLRFQSLGQSIGFDSESFFFYFILNESMDLWVVAAAAGAGYAAKHWRNISSQGREESSSEPFGNDFKFRQAKLKSFLRQIRESPLHRLALTHVGDHDAFGGKFWEYDHLNGDHEERKRPANLGSHLNRDVLSLVTHLPSILEYESPHEFRVVIQGHRQSGDESFPGSRANKSSRFNGSRQFRIAVSDETALKPADLYEDFIDINGQLYSEYVRTKRSEHGTLVSPSKSAVRPLLVTDGSRIIISRISSGFYVESENGIEMHREEGKFVQEGTRLRLPEIEARELSSGQKLSTSKRSSSVSAFASSLQSQGLYDPMPLFFLGLTIGVMTSVVANNREVDLLDERFRQAQNLVQDLHEELEMKDLLTVKEIDADGPRIPETGTIPFLNRTTTASSPVYEMDNSSKIRMREPNDGVAEKSDAMREIEAELEAELERLELNMKLTSVKNTSDFVEGDLRPEEVDSHIEGALKSNHDVSGSSDSQACSPNYAVSPQELSFRLHELIESRLEERIAELEAALEASQKKLRFLLLENENCQRDSIGTIASPLSDQENPASPGVTFETDGPSVADTLGEYLDAYKEAREETTGICELDGTDQTHSRHSIDQTEMESHCLQEDDQINWGDNLSTNKADEGRHSESLLHENDKTSMEWTPKSWGSS
ncbi:uncharacterized protein LOC115755804 [Rhodamnia argentea]|uniref:Uncharacterized protein LOC115755804 n=1 Tax=Rhodamnia argentea TaxID=178133 RepID=A0ABM3HH90_9MYRT|nr:uncharacterized protein LOC115755804 [Rhodamnia argentea]